MADESIVRAPLGELVAAMKGSAVERTALILVGPALGAEDFRESALYDADYVRRFRRLVDRTIRFVPEP